MTNEELQKMLTSFEQEVGHIKDWQIDRNLHLENLHNNSIQSGHLKNIAKSGGKAVGKNAHKRLNESQTFESRSRAHKKYIPKEKVEEAISKFIFNKDRANYLGINQVTYRKIVKEYGLYVKESTAEKFMKYCSAEERSEKLNKHKNNRK